MNPPLLLLDIANKIDVRADAINDDRVKLAMISVSNAIREAVVESAKKATNV